MEELIKNDPQSPDIGFGPILVVNEAFWTHVDGTSDVEIFEFLFVFDCESEVCDFG